MTDRSEDDLTALDLPTRWLVRVELQGGDLSEVWLNPSEVKARECLRDGGVSILMDDCRVYVSSYNIGDVLRVLHGRKPAS